MPRPPTPRNDRIQVDVSQLFGKTPPHTLEGEMALLGAMLLDPRVIGEVIETVGPEDFYAEQHVAIAKAMFDLYDGKLGDKIDIVSLSALLTERRQLREVGGVEFLGELAQSVPSAASAGHYAKIVADRSRLRKLIAAAGEIMYDAYHVGDLGPDGTKEAVERAEAKIHTACAEAGRTDASVDAVDLMEAELRRLETADGSMPMGISTGYTALDAVLGGLFPGDMVVIGARPSMGKTALALCLARHAARERSRVAIYSLEMDRAAIVSRLLSIASGVDIHKVRTAKGLTHEEYRELLVAKAQYHSGTIMVDDGTPTLSQLRGRLRRLKARVSDLKIVIIDYLQLMEIGYRTENRQVEVSAVSRGLKTIARELNVCVVALSQLNRDAGEGGRPRMSHLRESGSIEQDADVIALLHREDYYHKGDEAWHQEHADQVGVAEIIIEKQRNGPTDVVKLRWEARCGRFVGMGERPTSSLSKSEMSRFDGGEPRDNENG